MSRNGDADTTPLRTLRIVPAFSVTNRRPLPSPAVLTSVGERRPEAAFSIRMVVVLGLKPLPAALPGVAEALVAGEVACVATVGAEAACVASVAGVAGAAACAVAEAAGTVAILSGADVGWLGVTAAVAGPASGAGPGVAAGVAAAHALITIAHTSKAMLRV